MPQATHYIGYGDRHKVHCCEILVRIPEYSVYDSFANDY